MTSTNIPSMIAVLSQGNPGAARVLTEIAIYDPIFLVVDLFDALFDTSSQSFGLWLAYKDMSNFDIKKTIDALRDWMMGSKEPLEKWCENRLNVARDPRD